MISHLRRKPGLKKNVVFLVIVMTILIAGMIKIASVSFMARDPLAYLTVVSGKVMLSDGINEVDAKNGEIFVRDVRILLKTGKGIAKLRMRDGSYVIMDANSTIELNRQKEVSPDNYFVFNLITGKVMVISEKGIRKPVQFLIQNNVVVRGFAATLGAETTESRATRFKIDCMVGLCQINGIHLIISGQTAEIKPDNTLLIIDNASFTDWISLGKASGVVFDFPQLQVQVELTSIPTVFLTIAPIGGDQDTPIIGNYLSTPSPSSTTGILPTVTLTPTPTRTRIRIPPPTLTLSPTNPDREVLPTSTPHPSLTLVPINTRIPSRTFTPSTTASPSFTATLNPTDTATLQPFPTPTLTDEPTLTPVTPQTPTLKPSATPRPTRTLKNTLTLEPTPTETIVDSPVPTNTFAPVPSDTPVPTDTPIG